MELGFMTQKEVDENCAKLGSSMYGNVDASLRWFITLTDHLTGSEMQMKRSFTDPCIIYKQWEGKTQLITGLNVDGTLVLARKSKAKWFREIIAKRFTITCQEEVKKHLGVNYT